MINLKKASPFIPYIVSLIVIVVFIFTRFYRINTSLFFYNDMGRDLLVLQNWQLSAKPPLLGPQTSALPINQSAIYFYLLYPFYLITQGSPLSALIATTVIYLTIFILGLIILHHHHQLQWLWIWSTFLLILHPQEIIQNRYIWNPSLVTPLIQAALFSFYLLIQKFSHCRMTMFVAVISLAVSLTFSVAPLLIVLVLLALMYCRRNWFKIIFGLGSSLAIFNLPTIAYELRHNFQLTHSLLSVGTSTQNHLDFFTQASTLSHYLFNTGLSTLNLIFLALALIFSIIFFCLHRHSFHSFWSIVFVILLPLTLITPIQVQAHYIFPLLVCLYLSLLNYHRFVSIAFSLGLFLLGFLPLINGSYFQPAPRTYQQLVDCFTSICRQEKQPLFVSVQSSYHPYHNGPEHRYLLTRLGCSIKDETLDPHAADRQIIIEDGSRFVPELTHYYEVDSFGKYKVVAHYSCQSNLSAVVIQKLNP